MADADRIVAALNRNSEIVALAAVLKNAPVCRMNDCKRLATQNNDHEGYLCDEDGARVREWERSSESRDLPTAKMVRRLMSLLKGEAIW